VLDIVPDLGRALSELRRVLRPDGALLLQTPLGESVEPVTAAGFTVEEVVLEEQLDRVARQRLGLDLLPLYVCRPSRTPNA
jgi:hypothetical protein